MEVVANLNAKTKAIIRRDWLLYNFKEAFGSNQTATLLLDYARKHMPEELAEIERGYNETYEKRHKRLAERIAVIKASTANETEATLPIQRTLPNPTIHKQRASRSDIPCSLPMKTISSVGSRTHF